MPLGVLRQVLRCLRKVVEKFKHCICKCRRFNCSMGCEDVESDCCQDPPSSVAGEVVAAVEEKKMEEKEEGKKSNEASTETSQTDNRVYPEMGGDGPDGGVVSSSNFSSLPTLPPVSPTVVDLGNVAGIAISLSLTPRRAADAEFAARVSTVTEHLR